MIQHLKATAAGIVFIIIGLGAFIGSRHYTVGTALHMGPGYFPALLGALLVVLGVGAVIADSASKIRTADLKGDLGPLLLLLAGILLFSFLIERAGLVVAGAALLLFACFRRLRTNPLEVLLTYLVLTGFSAVVFVRWFGLQIPLFWWGS
jgi:hypothetical protein